MILHNLQPSNQAFLIIEKYHWSGLIALIQVKREQDTCPFIQAILK